MRYYLSMYYLNVTKCYYYYICAGKKTGRYSHAQRTDYTKEIQELELRVKVRRVGGGGGWCSNYRCIHVCTFMWVDSEHSCYP